MSEPAGGPEAVAVVVPAHDEETLLPVCLAAVRISVEALVRRRPGLVVLTLVVLDRCTDRSLAVCERVGVPALQLDAGNVGAARRAGVEHAVHLLGAVPATRAWIATTDADTVVPPGWLAHQVDVAASGGRLVVGGVLPDPADVAPHVLSAWHERHRAGEAGTYVHGANLGFALDAYHEAGGFPAVPEHEDVALVRALRERGVVPWHGLAVTTSGRRRGRVGEGFAGYLRDLDDELASGA